MESLSRGSRIEDPAALACHVGPPPVKDAHKRVCGGTRGSAPTSKHVPIELTAGAGSPGPGGGVKEKNGAGLWGRGSSTVKRGREDQRLRVISHHYIMKILFNLWKY